MANTVYYEPINGGDNGVWGPKELRQNRLAMGVNSCMLYDDSGTLKLTTGQIGIVTPSKYAKAEIDTVTTISVAALTASLWAKIEMSISGSIPSFTATSIVGANDPKVIPSGFANAFDGTKGGFYIDSSKRCIGIVWIDSGGNLDGVVNGLPGINGYVGSSESSENIFNSINLIDFIDAYAYLKKPKLIMSIQLPQNTVGGAGTAGSKQNRILNTEVLNEITGASIDTVTGIFTLPAGTYEFTGWAYFHRTGASRIWVKNITAGTWPIISGSARYNGAAGIENTGIVYIGTQQLTIASISTFQMDYQIAGSTDTNDLGYPTNYDVEIYAWLEVMRVK